MDNLTIKWHRKIIKQAVGKLNRDLTGIEVEFIESREGCMALEMIEDTVEELTGNTLVEYLNSEK